MAVTRIPFRNTGYFSSLICDLIDGHPAIGAYISRPAELDQFKVQMAEKSKSYPLDHRKTLTTVLREQYQSMPSFKKTEEQLSHIEKESCFTITTGHQLNLFTGPLYFFYKIISTINLCKQLKQKYPKMILSQSIGWRQKTTILRKFPFFTFREKNPMEHKQ